MQSHETLDIIYFRYAESKSAGTQAESLPGSRNLQIKLPLPHFSTAAKKTFFD